MQVKAHFTRYRRLVREHAMMEAKAIYQLKDGCQQTVNKLLLDDTFVYNIDGAGNVIAREPYRHPAIISMLKWFFEDPKSVGRVRSGDFVSSIPEAEESKEIPIPMLAFVATMLRAELSLWKFGRRETTKFDADQHYTVYKHHLDVLHSLQTTYPTRFHRLMVLLYDEAYSSNSAGPKGCEGAGVLGILQWDSDNSGDS